MTVLEEGAMTDRRAQLTAGDRVLTTVVHAALYMIGIMDQTGAEAPIMAGRGALIMAGTGVLNMVDTAGMVSVINTIIYYQQLCDFIVFGAYYCYLFTAVRQYAGQELN